MNYFENVNIRKPAEPSDGYAGGLFVNREGANMFGGTHGQVNTAVTVNTTVGKNVKAFEWNFLAKLENYADAGENCAFYAQANKHGSGNTWGACIEACDTTPSDFTGLVGTEIDCWVTGKDNGLRWGLDIVVGDSLQIRTGKKSEQADATYGLRIGASGGTPWAKWSHAIHAVDFVHSGLHLQSKAVRGVHLEGEYIVGLDLSTAKCQSAIRLAPGQRMTFEGTDQISWSWLNGRLRVQNGSVSVLEIDTTTGDIYKKGVKVL